MESRTLLVGGLHQMDGTNRLRVSLYRDVNANSSVQSAWKWVEIAWRAGFYDYTGIQSLTKRARLTVMPILAFCSSQKASEHLHRNLTIALAMRCN